MKNDSVYISQITDAIRKVELFIDSQTKNDFMDDLKTQSAIIMQLALIGELAKRVSDETKKHRDKETYRPAVERHCRFP